MHDHGPPDTIKFRPRVEIANAGHFIAENAVGASI